MNSIVNFDFKGHAVRTQADENGEPWFVAKDVCDVLEISKYRDALARLDDDEVAPLIVDTPGGPQKMGSINESGLFALILRSRKEKAKQFQKWVTKEVLPSIRKTGQYNGHAVANIHVPQTRLEVIELMLEHEKEREQDKGQIQHLETQHAIDAPKVAFCNQVIVAPDAISVGQAAKVYNTGRNRLYSDLRRLGWVNRRNEPYQSKIEAGYLDVKLGSFDHPDHGVKQSVTTLITGKGMVKLSNLLGHPLPSDFKQCDFHAQLH